jgi:hypothetical protein
MYNAGSDDTGIEQHNLNDVPVEHDFFLVQFVAE